MKIIFSLLLITVITISCNREDVYQPMVVDFENIAPFVSYEVSVKENFISIVTYGEDTLAITGVPMTINVPKEAVQTKASKVKLNFVPATDKKYAGFVGRKVQWQQSVLLMFEDTRNGDYDYNDLIVSMKCEWDKTTLYPIAYGALKKIDLGYGTADGKETYVVRDCRVNLFQDHSTKFINTLASDKPRPGVSSEMLQKNGITFDLGNGQLVYWFIETDGPERRERMYVVMNNDITQKILKENLVDKKGWPYGIAFPWGSDVANVLEGKGGPFYATEGTPIQKLYPHFEEWLTGAYKNAVSSESNSAQPDICYNHSR